MLLEQAYCRAVEPMLRILPLRYYENGGELEWPEEVLAERRQLRAQINKLQAQDTEFLRTAARRLGWTADTLEDLRSEAGNPFVEEPQYGRERVRRAREQGGDEYNEEWAYLCVNPYAWGFADPPKGCGWVRGVPDERPYDDIGMLSGSAGTKDYCRICGGLVGENRYMVS